MACVVTGNALCLNNQRFRVVAAWRKSDGSTGQGNSVALTPDSGYFSFFNAANIELVVKVLNGCSVNQHYWVFAAGLTNVEVTLTVTDTANATANSYTNLALGLPSRPFSIVGVFDACP